MHKNDLLKTVKTKLMIFLGVISIVCMSVFSLIACGDDTKNNEIVDPTYSLSKEDETDEKVYIKNPDFELDVKDESTFPITTTTGWSRNVDNGAKSSTVSSGVVNVSTESWEKLANELYKDAEYKAYVLDKYKNDASLPEDEGEKDAYLLDKIKALNPGKVGEDDYVYMLNNYLSASELGLGTAQKLTNSAILIERGKVAHITVNLKTVDLKGNNPDGFGANIRLSNSILSKNQADYKISNINTNGEWKCYNIYVQSDSNNNCTITLNLGLGYGDGSNNACRYYTEGTVFFDSISYETLDEMPTVDGLDSSAVVYASKTPIEKFAYNASTDNNYFYDMTFDGNYFIGNDKQFVTDDTHMFFTESNVDGTATKITSKEFCANPSDSNVDTTGTTADAIKLNLTKASYTVKIDNNGSNFSLDGNQFAIVRFKLLNNLNRFNNSTVTIDLFDIYNSDTIKRPAIKTFDYDEDTQTVSILVNNNFEDQTREFYLEVVVGPTDFTALKYESQLANGTVELTNLKYLVSDTIDEDSDDYNYYSFYTTSLSASASLYCGYQSDVNNIQDEEKFTFMPSEGVLGEIFSQPTDLTDYVGVVSNHAYITNKEGAELKTNTRSNVITANESYAGLINTDYLANYSSEPLNTALGTITSTIQPIVIYNAEDDCYGFIGKSNSIGQNAYAKITATVRVYGADAKAFIYLVDTSNEDKNVLSFDDFTLNTDYYSTKANGTEVEGSTLKYAIKVDQDMMVDGWLTVSFYIGTGVNSKNVRLEIWNGSRDGEEKSTGYVFVKDVTVTTSTAFTEALRIEDTFSVSGNPLFDNTLSAYEKTGSELLAYKRNLTELEKQFNEEHPDQAVSYLPSYVWAKTSSSIYGVYNTLEITESNPYDSLVEEKEEKDSENTRDKSFFWLSFSTILLGVVLVLAILALVFKTYFQRKKANESDAKSHYTVTSRISTKKKAVTTKTIEEIEEETEDKALSAKDEKEEDDKTETEEKDLDSYVYGDIQDFGENEKTEPENKDE